MSAPRATTHATHHPSPASAPLTHLVDAGTVRIYETHPEEADTAAQTAPSGEESVASMEGESVARLDAPATHDRYLKCASVTIRLSMAESAQLRKRAAESGLTVSAHMRSCTFEAESLRALVKETLAQLRTGSAQENRSAVVPGRRGWRDWTRRFWPHARIREPIAQS